MKVWKFRELLNYQQKAKGDTLNQEQMILLIAVWLFTHSLPDTVANAEKNSLLNQLLQELKK